MAADDAQEEKGAQKKDAEEESQDGTQETIQPRRCYIFCPAGDRDRLFEELDHKTAAPLIPAFRDYVLEELQRRGDLRQLEVISLKERMDAWVLDLKPEDRNVIEILEDGLKTGAIQIPGGDPNAPDGFGDVGNVTGYLNTFGVTVADRIRNQFMPLFDPASDSLSDEVLRINEYVTEHAGYLAEAQDSGLRDYAKTNSREYFADCFVYWITYSGNEKRMETFRNTAPQTYAYMEKLAANNWAC